VRLAPPIFQLQQVSVIVESRLDLHPQYHHGAHGGGRRSGEGGAMATISKMRTPRPGERLAA
jgi:hypothetical protein